jgi:hypothetical protein
MAEGSAARQRHQPATHGRYRWSMGVARPIDVDALGTAVRAAEPVGVVVDRDFLFEDAVTRLRTGTQRSVNSAGQFGMFPWYASACVADELAWNYEVGAANGCVIDLPKGPPSPPFSARTPLGVRTGTANDPVSRTSGRLRRLAPRRADLLSWAAPRPGRDSGMPSPREVAGVLEKLVSGSH